jgi:hypothetical protein
MAADNDGSDFRTAKRALPLCMIGTWADDATTVEELVDACKDQLQRCVEGQDGTEYDDPKAIRKWLKKWDK